MADVQSSAAGRKDMTVAAMQAWEEVFCKKKATPFESASLPTLGKLRPRFVPAYTETNFAWCVYTGQSGSASSRDAAEAETVAGRLMAVGDNNLLINGIHHNLHAVRRVAGVYSRGRREVAGVRERERA